jgi:hypothetical protein
VRKRRKRRNELDLVFVQALKYFLETALFETSPKLLGRRSNIVATGLLLLDLGISSSKALLFTVEGKLQFVKVLPNR